MCFIHSPQIHLRMQAKPHDSQVIVLSKPNSSFCGMRSWPSRNTELQNQSFDCCAQMWFWTWQERLFCFSQKTSLSHTALEHSLGPYLRLHGEHAFSDVLAWLMFVRCNLALTRGLRLRLLQTPSENSKSTDFYSCFASSL